MTIQQFLALFPMVKETKKGWDVQCPAHDDQKPSLGVKAGDGGRIVLHCLAGCGNRDIMFALGLTLADLFPEHEVNGHAEPLRLPPVKTAPVKLAMAYELHAHDLRMKAQKILETAKGCEDCETWTNAEREQAMAVVNRAYINLERARFCEEYADHLREEAYVTA